MKGFPATFAMLLKDSKMNCPLPEVGKIIERDSLLTAILPRYERPTEPQRSPESQQNKSTFCDSRNMNNS
jgi:hypothetical protein